MIGYNLFAYCSNNPVMYIDSTGKFAGVLTFGTLLIGAVLVVALVVVGVELTRQLCRAIETTYVNSAEIEQEKEEVEPFTPEGQAYFTYDPQNFRPNGLIKCEYPGSKNGRIIKWKDPNSLMTVFEWDEDLKNGAHYHVMPMQGKEDHMGLHYKPGTLVPEPWSSIYFGGH